MKRTLLVAALVALLAPATALAQAPSASGTLAVSATVQSSVSLVFTSDGSGVTLGGTATAATLAFGNVSAYSTISTSGITRTVNGTTDFTVSSPLNVTVNKANYTSSDFTLTAQLSAADSTNTWKFGGVDISDGTSKTITATGAYGTTSETVALTVPFSASAGAVSKTITVTATAN